MLGVLNIDYTKEPLLTASSAEHKIPTVPGRPGEKVMEGWLDGWNVLNNCADYNAEKAEELWKLSLISKVNRLAAKHRLVNLEMVARQINE